MKKQIYIASLAFATLLMVGCEKTEFSELMEDEVLPQEQARTSNTSQDFDDQNTTQRVKATWIPVEDERPSEPGVVKEVSDGDDESDDDDTSSS